MLWQPDIIEINATAANAQACFLPSLAPLSIILFIAIPAMKYKSLERGDILLLFAFRTTRVTHRHSHHGLYIRGDLLNIMQTI
ncbi:hypothetical protein [Mesorhizobium sp. M7A.F.Ca.AU.002.02.1.1]|nr:hypothetical protein [Mesorhizobium sp. M7A.F.Ca.AU.002.02.1.1]